MTGRQPRIVRVVLADPMPGVRAGLRWLLRGADVLVSAEADTVAAALAAPGDVIVAGLTFADGTAADLCAGPRPVVVYTWLPADERDIALRHAAAVLRTGTLQDRLADAITAAHLPQ